MSALRAVGELRPDVVLLDVQLPDADGFEVAARLTAGEGAPAVVLTSSRDRTSFGQLVAESGARGFIAKAQLSGERIAKLVGTAKDVRSKPVAAIRAAADALELQARCD